jgi:hypothetical protein
VAYLITGVIRRFLFLTAACVLSCGVPLFPQTAAQAPPPADYNDPEGYAVLSVLLEHYHSEAENTLQISSLTASGPKPDSFDTCATKLPPEFATAADDYKDKNKQNSRVVKKFNLKFGYKFVDLAKKRQPLAPTNNAKGLPPPLFDHDVYEVSAVGFDASHTHAIAYVSDFCGPDCSSGAYHLLVKEKDGWKEFVSSPVCEWMRSNREALAPRSPSS